MKLISVLIHLFSSHRTVGRQPKNVKEAHQTIDGTAAVAAGHVNIWKNHASKIVTLLLTYQLMLSTFTGYPLPLKQSTTLLP
jgi:hypothetical protein